MAAKIQESIGISESQAREERDALIAWASAQEAGTLPRSYADAVRLADSLAASNQPERVIDSARRIAARLEEKVRALKG